MLGQDKKNGFHERLVPDGLPWYHKQMYANHMARYNFATKYVINKQVLDIACGSGYGSLVLAEAGASKVFGVDISRKTVAYAKKRYPHKNISYKVGNAIKIPLNTNSVDVLVSFETLEHIDEHKIFIKEIKRVLKKDGLLVISTPNILLGNETANPFHLKELSLDKFKNLLTKNFTDVEIWGQKPMHAGYLKFINKITNKIKPGKIRWLVDTGFKFVFRGSKVKPLGKFKYGFTPYVFIGVARNEN